MLVISIVLLRYSLFLCNFRTEWGDFAKDIYVNPLEFLELNFFQVGSNLSWSCYGLPWS